MSSDIDVEADVAAAVVAIQCELRKMLDACDAPDDLYGADGRALGQFVARFLCLWCRADRYNPATGRCPRCNEPYYDGVLAWPGPTTATLTPCALRFGGGSREPSEHLSVALRMARHGGSESTWGRLTTEGT